MKKVFLLLILTLCLSSSFAVQAEGAGLSIMTVNFPSFDIARSIVKDLGDVQMLLPAGSDSHSYEPSPQDIIAIQEADLFIYTGGGSDTWVEEIIVSMGAEAPVIFRLADSVTLLEEETSQSMDHRHVHDEHCTDESHHHHDHAEMDEHVWTSPKNVMRIARDLTGVLSTLAPENTTAFETALNGYLYELDALDRTFEDIVSSAKRDVIIFGDRFPLRYFAADYGLRYDAAFPGCSEDSEPSVRTVISLVDEVRAQQIPVIFYIEFSSRRTADILAEETGAKPMLFHSCHNVSAEEIEAGATYLTLMKQNAEALKEALN